MPLPEGAVHFEIDLPATGDSVSLMVIDGETAGWGDGREAVFSPARTCVGVALASGLALATARLAEGRYIDEQIGMISGRHEPDQVVSRARLLERGDGAVCRHHDAGHLRRLLADFDVTAERDVEVPTMNGHRATALQLLARRR